MTNEFRYLHYVWTDSDILSATANFDTSLNQRSLDVDTMTVKVKCEDDITAFQQNDPVRFFRGGSQYALWYVSSINKLSANVYELNLISSLGRVAQLPHKGGVYGYANDGATKRVTSGDLIREICGYVNGQPTSVEVYVAPAFENTILYGHLPYVSPSGENGARTGSAKDNLLQVLFALNASIRDDEQGVLRIENLSSPEIAEIGVSRVYANNASVKYDPPVTSLTVLEHSYTRGTETRELFNANGEAVDQQTVVFDEPVIDLTPNGLQIIDSGANYAVVTGTGSLTGTLYNHTTKETTREVTTEIRQKIGDNLRYLLSTSVGEYRISRYSYYWFDLGEYGKWYFYTPTFKGRPIDYSWKNEKPHIRVDAPIFNGNMTTGSLRIFYQNLGWSETSTIYSGTSGEKLFGNFEIYSKTPIYGEVPVATPNTVRIESATMVGATNVGDVSKRLVDYYKHRTRIEEDCVIDWEDAGDVVSLIDPSDFTQKQACIEKIQPLTVSGIMKGRVSALVGYTPYQVEAFEDNYEVFDGSGTFEVPEGVTFINVVLISGGSSGESGQNGKSGGSGSRTWSGTLSRQLSPGSYTVSAGKGGDGGDGGLAGEGGRIFRTSFSVTAGQILTYQCGAGGVCVDGTSALGGDTTIEFDGETYTTENSSSSSTGYTNVVTGETYGLPGNAGIAGGKGGDGGELGKAGAIGESVQLNIGGNGSSASLFQNIGWLTDEVMSIGGFGGGGAAANQNGGAGGSPSTSRNVTSRTSQYVGANGTAGAGASADQPIASTTYGAGGNGGNGGGGGGGSGAGLFQLKNYVPYNSDMASILLLLNGGTGGNGSLGGSGGNGCVIFIYRQTIPETNEN